METLKIKAYALIRKSERFFKTDMVYVARGGFWLGFNQIASAMIVFMSSLFFANFISKDLYGNYKFILTATSILGAFSLSGMGTVITQGVARGTEGILKDSVRTSLRWGGLVVLVACASALYYFVHGNTILGFGLLIAGVTLPFINAYTLYGNYLMGIKDFQKVAVYALITQGFTTVSVIMATLLTHNAVAMVFAYFLLTTLTTVWAYWRITKIFHINSTRDKTLIPYSKHLSLMNVFNVVANQLDKVLVFHYLGAISLAVYAFSQAIPDQAKGAFKSLFGIALPKYAALGDRDLRASIMKKTIQLTILAAVLVGLYVLAAPLIFKILFPKYLESVFYTQIYMLGLIAIPGISLFGIYFQLKQATKTLYKLTVISNVATIILTFVLIYNFGLKGAVIENGISWLIMLLVYFYYFATDRSSREIAQV